MKNPLTDRLLALVAIFSLLAVGIALVSQHVFDLQPCAWCVLQRLIYLAIALFCVLALVARRSAALQRLFAAIAALLGAGGIAAAIYQHDVASQMLSCSQTFADRFMTRSGLDEALPSVFGIFATCMDAAVDVLGVRYEIWSLLLFALLTVALLAALTRSSNKRRLFS
ncbi:disulfide bond formation protein B [Pigmentiphaga soli]|uniref:Disulfide bond formation protein B n=1 Tax=Pigmentiphaga soli TaxID=1007095 RepID=A0ABP8HKG0_9BURK